MWNLREDGAMVMVVGLLKIDVTDAALVPMSFVVVEDGVWTTVVVAVSGLTEVEGPTETAVAAAELRGASASNEVKEVETNTAAEFWIINLRFQQKIQFLRKKIFLLIANFSI